MSRLAHSSDGDAGPRGGVGKALLLLASFALALLFLEVAFRWLDLRGHHEPRQTLGLEIVRTPAPDWASDRGDIVLFQPDSQFSHVYDGDPRGYFGNNERIDYRINRHGFRGPDWNVAKPAHTQRVVLVGDSFTLGEGVRVEDTLGAQLADILNAAAPGPVEVLNFAIGGWGTREEIGYLEQTGLDFEPDLVVVVYVLNDADYAGGLDLWDDFRERYEQRPLRSSHLASFLFGRIAHRELARRYVEALVDDARRDDQRWEDSFSALSRGKRLVEAAGGRFAVAIYPFLFELDGGHPFRGLHEKVVEHCVRSGIDVLDLFGSFEGRAYADLWVHPSDQHPNEVAHSLAARSLAGFILERSLL